MKTENTFIKTYFHVFILGVVIIIPFVILFFLNPQQRYNFTREDGIIENSSAIYFFLSSSICFLLFFKSSSEEKKYFLKSKRNYFFLLLGLFFLICLGEEISWGQRIFGFATPEVWKADNIQGETNIHNLYFFSGVYKNHLVDKSFIAPWLQASRMYLLFWFFFCLVIPILNALSSKVRDFTKKLYFPIIPIWIGVLFLLNYSIFKVYTTLEMSILQAIQEITEANSSLLFLVASIQFYVSYKNKRRLTTAF